MSLAHISFAARSLLVLTAVTYSGCTNMKTTNTARSSTEQMLVSNAIDQSLDKIDFRPFAGHAVLLEEKYIDCVDKAYVIGSIRHRLLRVGSRLVDKPEEAEIVVEARSGSVGTTNTESYLGVPEITLPGLMAIPEVRFITKSDQIGVAKIGIAAYDAKTRLTLGEGGTTLAKSDDSNLAILGINLRPSGSIRNEITRSTSGNAAISRPPLPVQVAFHAPAPAIIPATPATEKSVEYTSAELPQAEEAPAAEASETDAPGWAN